MFAAEMANHCTLGSWTTNSQVSSFAQRHEHECSPCIGMRTVFVYEPNSHPRQSISQTVEPARMAFAARQQKRSHCDCSVTNNLD